MSSHTCNRRELECSHYIHRVSVVVDDDKSRQSRRNLRGWDRQVFLTALCYWLYEPKPWDCVLKVEHIFQVVLQCMASFTRECDLWDWILTIRLCEKKHESIAKKKGFVHCLWLCFLKRVSFGSLFTRLLITYINTKSRSINNKSHHHFQFLS